MIARLRLPLLPSLFLCLALLLQITLPAAALAVSPAASAEQIRAALVLAQLNLGSKPASAQTAVTQASAAYQQSLAPTISVAAPAADQRARAAFAALTQAAETRDTPAFAAARAQAWTAILAGAEQTVEAAVQRNDLAQARAWLTVREFRTATRYSRPGADATLAVERLSRKEITPAEALQAIHADLLDTYQARLDETLRALPEARKNKFAARSAELSAQADGYFAILAPAYAEQRGQAALTSLQTEFAALLTAQPGAFENIQTALTGFRAAPLSPAEQTRRAGQLIRFISLVPVEYGRGVNDGRVIHDFEIQEAISFYNAARGAFADLQTALPAATVTQATSLLDQLDTALTNASRGSQVSDPAAVQAAADQLTETLKTAMPASWLTGGSQGDFDVIASLLDQVETAVQQGQYEKAESARLEAYALLETGPEARLIVLAPQLAPGIETLFWNGQDEQKGLAYLINNRASLKEIQASRAQLDQRLAEAEHVLGQESSPWAVAVNAGVIVFREGMEAVVILASLMSSMRRAEEKKYRKPMWWGAIAAMIATMATWFLARGVLQSLARYGEKLEAVVSLIAVAILLVIMNWFFHKVYWTSWIAQFHSRKRQLLNGETGLMLGLVTLGFTSIYREGFEVVLFLQALVLEAGSAVVLSGTAAGLVFVVLLGIITFRLQITLPYRNMLIVTGMMIGAVLLQIVGKTVYAMQVVGWMPIHSVHGVTFPYWWGSWFGVYPTWEGTIFQFLAAGFVIGSYYLAEWAQKQKHHSPSTSAA